MLELHTLSENVTLYSVTGRIFLPAFVFQNTLFSKTVSSKIIIPQNDYTCFLSDSLQE